MKEITIQMKEICNSPDNCKSRAQARRHTEQLQFDDYDQIELDFTDVETENVGKDYLHQMFIGYSETHPEKTVYVCGMGEELFEKVKKMNQMDWESE